MPIQVTPSLMTSLVPAWHVYGRAATRWPLA